MTGRSKRVYWVLCAVGGVLLGLGGYEGAAVLALVDRQASEPGVTAGEVANLQFMTHTTRAVVGIFLGAMVLTTCVLLAAIRQYVETKWGHFSKRLIATVKVSIRKLDATLTAHDGLSDGRTADLLKAVEEVASQPLELVAAVRELSGKAGLAIEAAARQRSEIDNRLAELTACVQSVGTVVVGLAQREARDPVDREAEWFQEAVDLGRRLEVERRRREEGGTATI